MQPFINIYVCINMWCLIYADVCNSGFFCSRTHLHRYTKGILLPDGTIGQSTTNVDPRAGAPAAAIDTGLGRTNIGPIITAGVGFTMVNGYPAMHNGENMYAQDWAFLTQAMLATSAAARRYSYEHGAHAAETFAVETFSGTTAGGRAEILTAMGSTTTYVR